MSEGRLAAALALLMSGTALAQRPAGPPVGTSPGPVSPADRVPRPRSVLWIGAHPDDEVLVAPLLATWCGDERARCAILVMTRGENGACLLAGGCLPDLATVRSAEAGASSQLFGAQLILLDVPNGGVAAAGAGGGLASTIAAFIRAEAPDLVLTFDPRHGTTCHPDHRAVGAIVLEAASLLPEPPAVYLLESRLDLAHAPASLAFAPAAAGAPRFDANATLLSTGAPAWEASALDMERQPSQFDAAWLAALRAVPPSQRAVYLAPASWILGQPVSGCP
ncbi:MAG TPA: PIG-L family deacetylase [Thermoanaerobaculia bacterium]|nr:PIG-L family deacetylase [Thermoanaerobaculia bacterium]